MISDLAGFAGRDILLYFDFYLFDRPLEGAAVPGMLSERCRKSRFTTACLAFVFGESWTILQSCLLSVSGPYAMVRTRRSEPGGMVGSLSAFGGASAIYGEPQAAFNCAG
ncbi:MAG: hypothetical protein ABI407_17680 [Bradyrhizobium sp.]